MNKDIEKILKYQKVDMKLYLLDKQLKNDDSTKKLMSSMSRRKELKEEYNALTRDIESEIMSIKKATDDFSELLADVNDLENNISDTISIEKIDYFLKQIEFLLKKLKDVENIGLDSKKNLEKFNENADNDLKQIVKYTKLINELQPTFEKLKEEMLVEANKIKAELEKVVESEGIDKSSKVFEVYKNTRKRRMPVFVELNEENCGGCGVEISIDVINEANANGYAECPNCGRIMYVK